MSPVDRQMAEAWQRAAIDLDIEVLTPFVVESFDGEPIEFLALVCGFGAEAGTLICTTDNDFDFVFALSSARGYYASALNPVHYVRYDRDGFASTLKNWGWYGRGPAPGWYANIRLG